MSDSEDDVILLTEDDVKPVAKRTKPQPRTSAPSPAKRPTNAKDRFAVTLESEEREKKSQKEVALGKIHAESEYRSIKAKAKAAEKKANKGGVCDCSGGAEFVLRGLGPISSPQQLPGPFGYVDASASHTILSK
ncbi:hypothetical protein B0H19DRAFT_1080563 [Mycena capillaripes]|nr:hypothetical protein B0H19DRAFT_1080563 [Mycena capillaripes]